MQRWRQQTDSKIYFIELYNMDISVSIGQSISFLSLPLRRGHAAIIAILLAVLVCVGSSQGCKEM